MTLLINEIHAINSLQNGFILHIADQKITRNGVRDSERRKIFRIPYLNAGVGYFGLAEVNRKEYFSSWLPNFINNNSDVNTLGQFAQRLRDSLNRVVNKTWLSTQVSGLHICGYNEDRFPEFWIVRNTDCFEDGRYKDFRKEYYCDEEFLKRDAREIGFDGVSPTIPDYKRYYYINGDIRPFHYIWPQLDEFLGGMFSGESFPYPKTASDLENVAKWKMHVIASFYKKFARKKIIGTPTNAFILTP